MDVGKNWEATGTRCCWPVQNKKMGQPPPSSQQKKSSNSAWARERDGPSHLPASCSKWGSRARWASHTQKDTGVGLTQKCKWTLSNQCVPHEAERHRHGRGTPSTSPKRKNARAGKRNEEHQQLRSISNAEISPRWSERWVGERSCCLHLLFSLASSCLPLRWGPFSFALCDAIGFACPHPPPPPGANAPSPPTHPT